MSDPLDLTSRTAIVTGGGAQKISNSEGVIPTLSCALRADTRESSWCSIYDETNLGWCSRHFVFGGSYEGVCDTTCGLYSTCTDSTYATCTASDYDGCAPTAAEPSCRAAPPKGSADGDTSSVGTSHNSSFRRKASGASISRPSASVHCVSWSDRRKGFSINRPISRSPSNAHDARPTTTGKTTAGTVGARQSGSVKHHTLRKRLVCRA